MEEIGFGKKRLLMVVVVALLVVSTGVLFSVGVFEKGQFIEGGISLGITLALLIGFTIVLAKKFRAIQAGEPFEDELTKQLKLHAGFRTFLMSLYWLLAISFGVEELGVVELDVSEAIGLGIAGMAIMFALNYLYLSRKGVPGEK